MRQSAKVISTITNEALVIERIGNLPIGAVITASDGPINEVVRITNLAELENSFGSDYSTHLGLLAAKLALEDADDLRLVRVAGSAKVKASVGIAQVDASKPITISYRYYGTEGNKYSIVVTANVAASEYTFKVVKSGVILETLVVSTDNTSPLYFTEVASEYVTMVLSTAFTGVLTAGTYVMVGGNNGTSDVAVADYIGVRSESGIYTGAQLFRDRACPIRVLCSFGYSDRAYSIELIDIAESRQDIWVIYDMPSGLTFTEAKNYSDALGTYVAEDPIEGWCAETYWDWQYRTVGGVRSLVPPSCLVAARCVASIALNSVHMPVAGYSRGRIRSEGCGYPFDLVVDRDEAILARINPIVDLASEGIQIYGNETRGVLNTDLCSAHIARGMIELRSIIDTYADRLKFELNNEITWNTWKDQVDKELESRKSVGYLTYYNTKMDESIISPADIRDRIVRGMVQIQFTGSAEVFVLNYTVLPTGVSVVL